MAARDMAPESGSRRAGGSPGLGDDLAGADQDDRNYDSGHEVEYDDVDGNVDDVDVNAGYDDDGYSKETDTSVPDDDEEEEPQEAEDEERKEPRAPRQDAPQLNTHP